MYLKTQGIVLREVDYNDADKLLDVLTPDRGLLTVRARGIRRSGTLRKSACQLLVYAEFTLSENRGRLTVTEASPIEQFHELREDLELLSLSSYFAQAAQLLAQQDAPDPELLSLLLNALYALGKLKKPQRLVKSAFELRLACLAGFAPELSGCAVCGAAQPERLNVSQGVLECAACRGGEEGIRLPLSAGTLAAMRYISQCDAKRLYAFSLGEDTLRQLSDVTETYLTTQLEHSFSTLDFYKSLSYTTEKEYV